MEVIKEVSVREFLSKNEETLLMRESEHNLILGLSDAILKSKRASESPLFYTILQDGVVKGQAIRTNPDKPLALSYMSNEAVQTLVEILKSHNVQLHGTVGPINVTKKFSELWESSSKIGMHQGIYQLNQVIHPDYKDERMRLATNDDIEVVRSFSLGFIQDCFQNKKSKEKEAEEAANRNLKNQTLFLWTNSENEVVSMAAKNKEGFGENKNELLN